MRIEKNLDVQNNTFQNQENVVSTAKYDKKSGIRNPNNITISGAGLKGENLIQQRQGLARKQALKVVSDAFGGEKKLDAQMQSIKDEIKRLQDEINEKTADARNNDAKLKELQEEYGIDPDSNENKELSVLASKLRNPNVEVSDEELSRLSEYQQKALFYVTTNQQNSLDIDRAKAQQMGNVQGYSDMKRERLKSQDMLEAQEAAEKKKEEKKEEAKKLEKEAMQQEMIDNIKEHASIGQRTSADTKRAIARRERAEADSMESENIQKTIITEGTSMEDTQDAVNSEITNILNRLSLLANDVKGSAIDDQI